MTYSIRSHADFPGPSVWDRSSVTYVIVDGGPFDHTPDSISQLDEWYVELAKLAQQGTSLEPRSMAGTEDIGAALALMALNLQRVAGVSVDFCFGSQRPDGAIDVVVQRRHTQVGLSATRLAARWLANLVNPSDPEFDLLAEFARFTAFVATNVLGVMGWTIANAAVRRGIPLSVIDPRGRIVEFGNGRYRKRAFSVVTSLTPQIGAEIARDKHLTNQYLRAAGLPVPESIVVRSLDQALAAADVIGYPVAIKPLDLGAAIGVVLDLRNPDEVRARFNIAAEAASKSSRKLVVERFIEGNDYRALIIDDRLHSVRERIHPGVTGDGTHTIQQLIELENANPIRGTRATHVYKKIPIDEQVMQNLGRLGLSLDDVPAEGERIDLKLGGHRRDGALHIDCTHAIHPANVALLRTATKVVGLDIAGIDFVTPDIARPIWETGGAIIEINDGPAFNSHLFPAAGLPQDPGPDIMEMLFPPGQPVRVAVVAVTADEDSSTICRLVAQTASLAGQAAGLATREGVVIDGVVYAGVIGRNPDGPRLLLNNPVVEMAVVEVEAESIVEQGLGFDVCDVAVILSLSGLNTPYGEPVETVLLRALDPAGIAVLDGSDPELRSLASGVDAAVIFVNIAADDPMLAALLEEGHRAVAMRETPGDAVLTRIANDGQDDLFTIGIPTAQEAGVSPSISLKALQAAAAAAVGMNVPSGTIQEVFSANRETVETGPAPP